MRTRLWVSGAGGSGVLVALKEDRSWSPSSGILLHTTGLEFLMGVDIYDWVLVINDCKALEVFSKIRATLGGEISAVGGQVGAGGLKTDGKWKEVNRSVFTYLKCPCTIVIELTDENARLYEETIGVADILVGKTCHPPPEAAEGRTNVDVDAPRELMTLGIPDPEDPDRSVCLPWRTDLGWSMLQLIQSHLASSTNITPALQASSTTSSTGGVLGLQDKKHLRPDYAYEVEAWVHI